MRQRPLRASRPVEAIALTCAILVLMIGCSGIEKAPPRPARAKLDPSFRIEVSPIMRGTIASETIVMGYQPVIVRGYGLVVGLDGTGSRDIPPSLRAHMLAVMARRGVGRESIGMGHLKPEAMLDSPDTAVVIVEGVIPPGSVGRQVRRTLVYPGTQFDVRIYAHPYSGTTSLEGGRLYTTELRPVRPGEILPSTGSKQSAALAEARGPIFVNPFADPESEEAETINWNIGRIMNGGEVTRDIPLKLRLATPNHTRAEIIQSAVNTRFPQEPGQSDPTAHGVSDEVIRITVPPSYRNDSDDFVELLRHTTIRQAGVEAVAQSIKRVLLNDPSVAFDASWRWQALGPRALPVIQTLFDHPEELPRLAALRAGARLNDPTVIAPLIKMTSSASADVRRQAVRLLGEMQQEPRIDLALRAQLNDPNIDVRLAAYESLTAHYDPFIVRHLVDDKFVLDVVDSTKPMIYITQIGEPRVVVFGQNLSLSRPLLVDAWSGRLMVQDVPESGQVEVYYRSPDGQGSVIHQTDARLEEFVQFLGRETTIERPEPGLNLSYGETVGALYQIWRQKCLKADFKAEQDRVSAAIARSREQSGIEERPEFSDPDFDLLKPVETDDENAEEDASDLEQIAPPPAIGRATGG